MASDTRFVRLGTHAFVASSGLLFATASARADDLDAHVHHEPAPLAAPAPTPVGTPPIETVTVHAPAASTAGAVPPTDDPAETLRALRAAVSRLEARVDQLTTLRPADLSPTVAAHPPTPAERPVIFGALRPDSGYLLDPIGILLTGYIQADFQTSEQSQDALATGGASLNKDRFFVRRARLRLDGSWQYTTFSIELDGNTRQGLYFGLRRAEGSLVWRNPHAGTPPYLALTAGLQEIPFGREITTSHRTRYFTERTLGNRAFFQGEPDLGVRLWGGISVLRYALAVMNGTPLSDRPGDPGIDFTAAKDILGRVGVDHTFAGNVRLLGGFSFLVGQGFRGGTDATKPTLQWRDANSNGTLDTGEIVGVAGQAATPSATFQHWGVNVDIGVQWRTRIGRGQLYGEVTVANNLDRAQTISNPIALGRDVRQLAFFGAFTHEITQWFVVGFRYDYYHPDADFGGSRAGAATVSPLTQTFSPLVGFQLPDRARVIFQYDVVLDSQGAPVGGAPTDLHNNAATARLQLDF